MISIYGNCQAKEIHNMLLLSKNFVNKHGTDSYIAMNFVFIKQFNPIDEIIENFKKTKILIYQPLPEKYYPYSTDNLLKHLPEDCAKISFPYIFNDAIWGYPVDGNYKDAVDGDFVLSNQYENSVERFYYNLDITKEKETATTLKISNFIEKNYRDMELFYTQNHLNPVVIKELCRQILSYLEIEDDLCDIDLDSYKTAYGDFRWPITKKAKDQFGFRYPIKYSEI